jgi:hypothetical protein
VPVRTLAHLLVCEHGSMTLTDLRLSDAAHVDAWSCTLCSAVQQPSPCVILPMFVVHACPRSTFRFTWGDFQPDCSADRPVTAPYNACPAFEDWSLQQPVTGPYNACP